MRPNFILKFLGKNFNLLDKREDRFLMISICLIFSVLFLNIFVPFNINRWASDSGFIQFLRLSSYGVIVSIVFLFTQFPLRKWFRVSRFKIRTYGLWLLIEISLISLVYIFLYGNPVGNLINDFMFSVKYTTLGIFIPYLFSMVYIHYKKQQTEIKLLNHKINLGEKPDLISFKDENKNVKLSVALSDLLFLESTDNYVTVYYINKGKIQRSMVRNSMKKLEELNLPKSVIRCHRSYMINLANIEFIKKETRKLLIKIKHYDPFISVSQKYRSSILEILD